MASENNRGRERTVSSTQLIRAAKYREALSMCIREHGAALGRFCMAMLGDQRGAEEAVQETLVVAYDAMPYFEGDAKVRTWLFGLARRMCVRRVEARMSKPPGSLSRGESDAEAGLSEEALKKRKRAQAMRRALAHLKPSERDVVLLRYQSGLGYSEIARICGMDEDTTRKRASRALLRLREYAKEETAR